MRESVAHEQTQGRHESDGPRCSGRDTSTLERGRSGIPHSRRIRPAKRSVSAHIGTRSMKIYARTGCSQHKLMEVRSGSVLQIDRQIRTVL